MGHGTEDQLRNLLEELHAHGVEHDAGEPERLDRLRNLEPDTAQLLALLVRATAARRLLELGTSNGYSTLWLADAVRSVGGRLISVDNDAGRSSQAQQNLVRAGLEELVDLRVEDEAVTLRDSADHCWDIIFLDAERSAYAGYWPDLIRVMRPGALLAVDNVLSHAEEVTDLRTLVRDDDRVTEAVVPTGAGALLVVLGPNPA
jgi:predicted O-methyltransferase YrrM